MFVCRGKRKVQFIPRRGYHSEKMSSIKGLQELHKNHDTSPCLHAMYQNRNTWRSGNVVVIEPVDIQWVFRALCRTFRPSKSGNQNSLIICRRSGMQDRDGIPIFSSVSHPRFRQFSDGGVLTEMLLMEDRSLGKKRYRNSRFPVPCDWLCQPFSFPALCNRVRLRQLFTCRT